MGCLAADDVPAAAWLRRAAALTSPQVCCLHTNRTKSGFKTHHVRVWGPPDLGTPASVLRAVAIARHPHSPPFQGRDAAAVAVQIRRRFWPALRVNWQVWTPAQFVNINYVPLQVRASWHHAEPEGASPSTSLVLAWNDQWLSVCPESVVVLDLHRRSRCPCLIHCAQKCF